jgi:predicted nucleic acid-binding protein
VRSIVVSDAGPLISLGRLDLLALLPAQFAQVQVPQAVLDECLARPTLPDAVRIREAVHSGSLLVCDAVPVAANELDFGERAAIGRALEIGAGLLADDRAARAWAEAHGLDVIGTLGVLVRARNRGLIPVLSPLLDQLRASGQRLSHGAIAAALAAVGELPA